IADYYLADIKGIYCYIKEIYINIVLYWEIKVHPVSIVVYPVSVVNYSVSIVDCLIEVGITKIAFTNAFIINILNLG
ncbi:hypothetical protein OFB58_25200, partial [Escherichia coli]|nr:hypothetical protein [Escherichia coli]